MKLWQGVFSGPNDAVTRFNSSDNIAADQRLVRYDIFGNLAHIRMLEKQGMLSAAESRAIRAALGKILKSHAAGQFVLNSQLEDVHSNVENAVTKITPTGAKMHLGRSRNDQVILDMRLYLRDEILTLWEKIIELQRAFVQLSKKEGPFVGYTHTRVAQPITVSFWCDAQVQRLYRDLQRLDSCLSRINQNPLGAGAIAGTGIPIDRQRTAQLLGFDVVQQNELDVISSRGEMEAELLSDLSLLMVNLSGLSEELIWLSQKGLVRIPDSFCTGSSMMPNKKNPDVLELIRARSARVIAALNQVLLIKKGLISGYHSDMQETKIPVMEGIDTVKACLEVLVQLVVQLTFDSKKIEEELNAGYAQATAIADALSQKGIHFRDAHGRVGKLVEKCRKEGKTLSKIRPPLPEFSASEWIQVTRLDRPRLEKKIVLDPTWLKRVAEKKNAIQKAFDALME